MDSNFNLGVFQDVTWEAKKILNLPSLISVEAEGDLTLL